MDVELGIFRVVTKTTLGVRNMTFAIDRLSVSQVYRRKERVGKKFPICSCSNGANWSCEVS